MARISDPKLFSAMFGVAPEQLDAHGVFDPTLNADTPLFLDPALLELSEHPEMQRAALTYGEYFERLIALLGESKVSGDTYWRSAALMLRFPEVPGTCLGYGAQSISGSGVGGQQAERLIGTGADIIALGVKDPRLFAVMALFEAGIGADRIGDMATNVVLKDIVAFTERICGQLGIPVHTHELRPGIRAKLPTNPCAPQRTPVLLLPKDVLRHLPIASDWDSAMSAAAENDEIRSAVNRQVGDIWREKRRKDAKEKLREFALSSRENFGRVFAMIDAIPRTAYDENSDPEGLLFWRDFADSIASAHPLQLQRPSTVEDVKQVVEAIIEQFRHLLEKQGLWTELYDDKTKESRPERAAQKLFFAVATSYCRANNLDITPEADTGNGPVDFKFSLGMEMRLVVEVKLSTNGKLVHGYDTQTTTYQRAERAKAAYYLVVDIGGMGTKMERLMDRRNEMVLEGQTDLPIIVTVDGRRRLSASKRREA